MKLVTYDDGRVGEVVDGQVFELDSTGKPGAAIDSAIVGVVDRIDLLENPTPY